MKFTDIKKRLLTGLITIVPLTLTIAILFWFAEVAENFVGKFISIILPNGWYLPGMGLILGILVVFSVGFLMEGWAASALMNRFEQYVYRVPFVKSIYGSIQEFLHFVSHGKSKGLRQVVAVTLGGTDIKVIGFVTKNDLSSFPGTDMADRIAVFIPLSYQLGGYTALVRRSAIEPLDMPMEEALRFVLTAGIAAKGKGAPVQKNDFIEVPGNSP